MWAPGVCFTHQFSSEAYVSFSFNFSRLGLAFATVNVKVFDSNASLNIGKRLILYHRYFCSLPAHLPPHPPGFSLALGGCWMRWWHKTFWGTLPKG